MKLLDIVTAPWAILPNRLAEIQDIYARHLKGEKIDIEGIRAQLGLPKADAPGYDVVNGVAIIPVIDVIAKRMNFLMRVFGGTSTEITGQLIQTALADPDVNAIVLEVDSPGGTVDGTSELAKLIFDARGHKPMMTWANGLMASAGYWIGSATDATFIAADTTQVGSIGVVARHLDISQLEKDFGVKTTLVYAGKYKVVGHPYAPLSSEDKGFMQADVDYLYSIFVDTIAKHREVSVDEVLEHMAEGRVFIGQQAIDAGLVDGVATLDDVIAALADGDVAALAGSTLTRAQTGRVIAQLETDLPTHEDTPMAVTKTEITRAAVLDQAPDVAEAFRKEGRDSIDVATLQREAADAERARIQAVFAQSVKGHEKLIDTMAFDGKTTGPEAAVRILNAIRAANERMQQALNADAEELTTVASTASSAPAVTDSAAVNLSALPLAERAKIEWQKDAELRAEFANDFDRYLAYKTALENGQIKILKKV